MKKDRPYFIRALRDGLYIGTSPTFCPGDGPEALTKKELATWCEQMKALGAEKFESFFSSGVDVSNPSAHLEKVRAVARELVLPPPGTATNLEVLAMSMATLMGTIYGPYGLTKDQVASLGAVFWGGLPEASGKAGSAFLRAGLLKATGLPDEEDTAIIKDQGLARWLQAWKRMAFARLEIGHKLAAALCLTDVPQESIEVRAPWDAWSLLVPDGLLGDSAVRVWCLGIEPQFVVSKGGKLATWADVTPPLAGLIGSLVRASCLVLSDAAAVKHVGRWGTTVQGSHRRREALEGARYLLAHPVSIDLRGTITEVLTGKRPRGAPKVQYVVRGHPRMQAHGAGRALRTKRWIEPHYRGPVDGKILLRPHQLKDRHDDEPTTE